MAALFHNPGDRETFRGIDFPVPNTPVHLLKQLRCPVCLQLPAEPVVTSCGHMFCKDCIWTAHSCPLCRSKEFTISPDNQVAQLIRSLPVKCSHLEKGCKWEGQLGDALDHLAISCNKQTSTECPFACGVKASTRYQLIDHVTKGCPNRFVRCPYCGYYGLYKKVTTTHYMVCEKLPLTCPAYCSIRPILRKDMGRHLSRDCPEERVTCTYAGLGCDQVVRRSSLREHVRRECRPRPEVLESLERFCQVPSASPDLSFLPLSFSPWLVNHTPTCYPRPPWVIKMEGFRDAKVVLSEPVYSHFGGYKMALVVWLSASAPSGARGSEEEDATEEDCNVSMRSCLLPGDNGSPKVPFTGLVTVTLLNQEEDRNHWCREMLLEEEHPHSAPTWMARVNQFIQEQSINCSSNANTQYTKNNTLFFRVDRIASIL